MTDFRFKPKEGPEDLGWYDRGYLPHFDAGERAQLITFRLFDSMPGELLDQWRAEAATDMEFRKRIEAFLDAGSGECWLRDVRVASVVRDALAFHSGKMYRLSAWVIMPNHVHVLITPLEDAHLPEIMHSIKSFTAKKANVILGRSGAFWQRESFDRYIRNADHFRSVIRYIENNPVKAGLCTSPEEWRFSSAYERSTGA